MAVFPQRGACCTLRHCLLRGAKNGTASQRGACCTIFCSRRSTRATICRFSTVLSVLYLTLCGKRSWKTFWWQVRSWLHVVCSPCEFSHAIIWFHLTIYNQLCQLSPCTSQERQQHEIHVKWSWIFVARIWKKSWRSYSEKKMGRLWL